MTKIMIVVNDDTYDICVNGHADKINEGEGNLLCSAVSTLTQTLLQKVRDMEEDGLLTHRENISDGRVRIICKAKKNREYIRGVLQTIETGFLLLQNGYKKNILVVGDGQIWPCYHCSIDARERPQRRLKS